MWAFAFFVMDPDAQHIELPPLALTHGKNPKSNRPFDFYDGKWVKPTTLMAKVGIVTETNGKMYFQIGSLVVTQPSPAMQALLNHKRTTGKEPEWMLVTDTARQVSFLWFFYMPCV